MNDLSLTRLTCQYEDCGYEWLPRTDHLPKVCPKCKRYDWNTPHPAKASKESPGKGGTRNVATAGPGSHSHKGARKRVKKPTAIERFQAQHLESQHSNE